MSFAIQNTSKRYTNIADFPTTDVRTDMVGEYILGVSQSNTQVNTADRTKPLFLQPGNTGPIVYGSNFATVKNGDSYAGNVSAGLDTGIYLGPKSYTMIQVSRGSKSALGAPQNFFGMRYFQERLCVYNSNGGDLNAVPDLPSGVADASKFYFTAARMPYLGVSKLYRYENGVLSSSEEGSVGGIRDATQTFQIGGSGLTGSASIGSIVDVGYVAIYEKALTDGEIAAIYADLKIYLASYRGLVVS